MTKSTSFSIPPGLLILDLIGALMAALGIVETTDAGIMLPQQFAFPFYNWVFIIVGALLMLPMVLHMVARAKQQAAGKEGK